jgi:hypothetical protein
MSRHAYAKTAMLFALGATLALPATGWASDGGVSADAPATGSATSSPNGIELRASAATLVRQPVTIRGSVPRGSGNRVVLIERTDGHRWVNVARVRASRDRSFAARWSSSRATRVRFRARFEASTRSSGGAGASSPQVRVTVYQPSRATWYGPGFYGHRTACGQTLSHSLLGVANRTLPCGTKVDLYYRGRSIRVPVVDRGPYANHADWDLTSATADRLHMHSTETIGTLVNR